MSAPVIGFIGFGEAAHSIASGLRSAGADVTAAYDVNAAHAERGERIRRRAQESGVRLVESLADLAASTDLIFSAVVAAAAESVASAAAPALRSSHLFIDLNSTSPAVKQAVAVIVSGTGARFVEAAVMAPVPPHGHKVPMLVAGCHACAAIDLLSPYGMRLERLGDQVGSASAVKMFRSILIKGLEALILECLLGASQYGAEDRVFASMSDSFPGLDWNRVAHYLVGRSVLHGERRAHEMKEAADTLRSMGIDPIMADAVGRRLGWCADLRLRDRMGDEAPADYRAVIRAIFESKA